MDTTLTQILAGLYASDALGHAAQQRVAELEAELARLATGREGLMSENAQLVIQIDALEVEVRGLRAQQGIVVESPSEDVRTPLRRKDAKEA